MKPMILTHGGAGAPADLVDGPEAAARAAMALLLAEGDPLEAAIEAARVLEDDPRFNAGTGSNLRLDGARIQMDASLMSDDGRFGAVLALERTKNPILVARAVMDTPHLMIAGEGAINLARRLGFPDYDPTTPRARQKYERWRLESPNVPHDRWRNFPEDVRAHDTIGAVVRGRDGRFAVSCSTGGTTMMLLGRVGDSPIPGAGLYAGPAGAVTATGEGEEIIRRLLSLRVYERMARGESCAEAGAAELAAVPKEIAVGLIAVGTRDGWGGSNRQMPFCVLESEE
ncbi:MAG TPA: isoaspartyl peptidase/L-asparaginase [Candidatus Eisenbacteria bacterium]